MTASVDGCPLHQLNTSTPTPDPTVLTTEQLERAIGNLKSILIARIEGHEETAVHRIARVDREFELIERMRVEQKKDTKDAVDAALAAAKEAVKENTTAFGLATAKSETAVSDQLKQLTVTFNTAIGGLERSMSDLKTRVERIENVKQGGKEVISGMYALAGFVVSVIVILGMLVATGAFDR